MFLQIKLCPLQGQAGRRQSTGSTAWGMRLQGVPTLCCAGLMGTKLVCNWVVPSSPLLWVYSRLVCVKLKELCYLLARESVCPSPNLRNLPSYPGNGKRDRAADVGQQELCTLAR